MYIDTKELFVKCINIFIVLALVAIGFAIYVETSKMKVIDHINSYQLVELEDGHYYLRSNRLYDHSISHWVDCPKCKKTKH